MTTAMPTTLHGLPVDLPALLAYRAPFLEDRMVRERKVAAHEEAARLLDEVKKYLVLSRTSRDLGVPMFSRRIDEVWHQFVLFTAEYEAFSLAFFGRYVHHFPGTAPRAVVDERQEMTREEFARRYEALFGPVSPLWRDELSLTVDSRVTRKRFDRAVEVRAEKDKAALVAKEKVERFLLRLDAWAIDAVRFIAENEHFYIRELPGPLTDDERVAICRPLVAQSFFRVAL